MAGKFLYKPFIVSAAIFLVAVTFIKCSAPAGKQQGPDAGATAWHVPDTATIALSSNAALIRYGKELVINTAKYLGPSGSIAHISNGMNCGNCHLEAGTRLNANCFAMVASSYPKLRHRSGKVESVVYKINDCLERSLNGQRLDSLSKEMKAMVAYITWVGKEVKPTETVKGTGVPVLPLLPVAASVERGQAVFNSRCASCHGINGAGLVKPDSSEYVYPPVFGDHSYNVSAGIFMLSRLAGFIKYNMPYTAVRQAPALTDEEAWNVAAFVNSQPRPEKRFAGDWPVLSDKPVDYPFGPYADSFSETRHKYGPFNFAEHKN